MPNVFRESVFLRFLKVISSVTTWVNADIIIFLYSEMDDLEKDPLVTTEVTVYKRRWYILLGNDHIHTLTKYRLPCQDKGLLWVLRFTFIQP